MIEAISCGGVVIFRGKILLLYKNYKNKYEGWVLPKGTVEPGENYKETAIRIPMLPAIRSLNLSNSVAVVLYEALRQNQFASMKLEGQLTKYEW